ncbi:MULTISPECIES: hypothetical protein [Methylotenera]|uniref:hypothetical protein n=1 Tax=Methylotenera TaxID=359407 RepID=UPI000399D815|nr:MULTISPECIES: hypothetical protein [Methylotenera]
MSRQKRSEVELSPNMQNLALRSDDFAGDEFDEYSETGIETSLKFKGQEIEESYGGFDDYALGI